MESPQVTDSLPDSSPVVIPFAPSPTTGSDVISVDDVPGTVPPAEALSRLIDANLLPGFQLDDRIGAEQLRAVFAPIVAFMRAFEDLARAPVAYSQPGLPSAGQGLNGDLWLNELSGTLYTKQDGAWRSSTQLRGADGYTPLKGVDYVDQASLATYAAGLTETAVQAARQEVAQTVQTALASLTVMDTDGNPLPIKFGTPTPDPGPGASPELEPTPAPGPQPIPDYAVIQPARSWEDASGAPAFTIQYADNWVITRVVRETPDMVMTCQLFDFKLQRVIANYSIPFTDSVADINIEVPTSCIVFLHTTSPSGASCSYHFESYTYSTATF